MMYIRSTASFVLMLCCTFGVVYGQQAPLSARSDAPVVQPGDTLTVSVALGSESAPVADLLGVGFQLEFHPEHFAFVGFQRGGLFAGELSNGTALEFIRGMGDSDGDGVPDATEEGFVAYSVTLTGSQGKTARGEQAIGQFTFAARATADTLAFAFAPQDASRSTPADPDIEITNLQEASVEVSTTRRARRKQVGAGDPPLIRFPKLDSLTIDFSSLDAAAELTIMRSTEAPGGTDLPNGSDDYRLATTGFWQLAQSGATDFTAEVCLPFALITDRLIDNDALRLVKRPDETQDWTILQTSLQPSAADPEQACATITSFSDLTAAAPLSALPVELARFEATVRGDAVALAWQTLSETSNHGFAVQRSKPRTDRWVEVAFVEGAGTTTETKTYQYIDDDLPFGAETVRYRLKQIDLDGKATYSDAVEVVLARAEQVALHAASPNPFSQATTIRYELPEERHVRLELFDMLGQRVATLVDERQPAGRKRIRLNAAGLSAGVYVYRLQSGGYVKARRMVVVE